MTKVSNNSVIKYFFKKLWEIKYFTIFTVLGVIIVTVNSLLAPIYFKEIIDIISNPSLTKEIMLSENK